MREFKYDNAVIRITIPTEKQMGNIRKATERFLKNVVKEMKFNEDKGKTGIVEKP